MGTVLILVLGGFVLLLVLITVGMSQASASIAASNAARDEDVRAAVTQYGLLHAMSAGEVIIGASPERQALFYKLGGTPEVWIPYEMIASVELTPVYERTEETTSETRTRRGRQLVSAGIGAAIAGPVGAIVGGSGAPSTTTSSTSTSETLASLELKVRLLDPRRPMMLLEIGERMLSGSRVSPNLRSTAENMAALLANIVDENAYIKAQSSHVAQPNPPSPPSIAWPSKQLAPAEPQRGWWTRTFGG